MMDDSPESLGMVTGVTYLVCVISFQSGFAYMFCDYNAGVVRGRAHERRRRTHAQRCTYHRSRRCVCHMKCNDDITIHVHCVGVCVCVSVCLQTAITLMILLGFADDVLDLRWVRRGGWCD